MAPSPASVTRSGLLPYRVTVPQFRGMIDAHLFPEGARVELLGGILVALPTNHVHDYLVTRLANLLRPIVPSEGCLREEKSVQLGRFWRPQPDITVLRSPESEFSARSPRGSDVALLAEVADSSYVKDSGIKLRAYAAARIPVYWIVIVERRQVEVYSAPTGRGAAARYEVVVVHSVTDRPGVLLDGRAVGAIDVQDLFP